MASLRPETDEHPAHYFGRILSAPFDALGQRAGSLRAGGHKTLGVLGLSMALLLGGMAAGVLISTRWQVQGITTGSGSTIPRQNEREIIASTIQRLESEQADLKNQISDLRGQISD